jgi:hypothetical protein
MSDTLEQVRRRVFRRVELLLDAAVRRRHVINARSGGLCPRRAGAGNRT